MSLDWPAPSPAQPEIEHLLQRIADLEAAQVRWQQAEAGLREIAEHHRTLLQHLKQVVFQTDVAGRWLFLNPAWTEITGFEVTASLGQIYLDYVHPDDRQRNLELFQPLLAREKADCRHEIRYRHADGGFRWVEVWARLTVDEHDQVIGTTGTLTDISQRKQLEIALQQSEQNVRTFFDTIDDLLFVLDEQGRILFTNNAVTRRLGYTPEDMQGQSVLMVHPAERQAEAAQIVAAMLAGQAEYCPVPVQTKDGQQIPVETRVTVGQWNGQPVIFGVTKNLSALKASEETFTKAFQASPTLMALSEVDTGRYLDVNVAFLHTLGYTREEVVGHSTLELNLFANLAQREAALQLMQQQGFLRDYEVAVRTRSGEIRHGLFSAEFIQLQDRRVLLTAMNDITARQQAESALAVSELKFRRVVEAATDAIVLLNEQGAIIEWNPQAEVLTGFPRQAVLGEKYWTIQAQMVPAERRAPDMTERLQQIIETALRVGQSPFFDQPLEVDLRRADGQLRHIWQFAYPIPTEHGFWMAGSGRDMTEQIQTQTALRDSEQRYRTLAEASRDLIFIIDRADQVEYVNSAAAQQVGRTPAELIGQPRTALFPPTVAEEQRAFLTQVFDTGEPILTEGTNYFQGHTVWLSSWLIPLHDQAGVVRAVLGVSRDITERKHLEQNLERQTQHYQILMRTSRDAIHVIDRLGRLHDWNEAFLAHLGYSAVELDTLTVTAWDVQWGPAELLQKIDELIRQGATFETQHRRKDGTVLDVEITAAGLVLDGEEMLYASARDITERKRLTADLRQQNLFLEKIISRAAEGLCVCHNIADAPFITFTVWNDQMRALTGYTQADINRLGWYQSLYPAPADRQRAMDRMARMRAGEDLLSEEWVITRADGAARTILISTAILETAGDQKHVLALMHDITDRKQMEEQLAASERFARATLDALQEHLCVLDDTGMIVAVNQAWRSFADANPPVLVNYGLGANYLAVCDGAVGSDAELAKQFAAGIRAVLRAEIDQFIMDYPCHSPDEQRWFTGKVTRFPGAGPIRLVVTHDNITDRKRAEEAMRQAEEHYRNLFENAPVMYALTRTQGATAVIADCNRQFAETLGYTMPEIIGRPIADLHTPASRALFAEGGYERGLHGQFGTEERQLVTRDGRILTVLISAQPHHDTLGGVVGTRAILLDITTRLQAEARLRRFWDLPLVGMALTSTKRSFLSVNQKLADMFGYPAEQLAGMSWVDLTYPDDIAENIRLFDQTLAGERDEYDMDKRFIRRDGTLLYTHIAARCIRQLDGTVDHLALIIQDISERKQIEVALRSSETRQRALLTAIPDLMFVLNRAGVYLDYHAPRPDLLAAPPDTILGRALHEVLPPELTAVLKLKIEQAFQTGQIQTHVYSLDLATGPHYFEARLVVYDNDLVLIIVRDITDRKQAEAALRESQALYHSLVESSPLSICRKDLAGCFTFANRRFLDESQISLADLIGKTDFELHPPELAEKYRRDDQAVIASGQIQELIEQRALAQGETSVVQTIKVPIRDDAGRINGIQISFWDITERQQAQDALRDLTDTLERRVADRTTQLTGANLRLTELDRLKDEFISRISHELRTPLTNIISYLELLTYGKPEKHERYLGVLHTQTELFRKLIEDLLDVSRLRLDDAELRVSDFDLAIFIGSLVSARRSLLERRHIQIVLDLDTVHDTLTSDASVLRQVMVNILTNALSYTPEGGLVTLSAGERTAADRSWMTFAVRDSGPGISARDLPYIFEPFYRGAAANDYKTPGTGVGLTIAQRLIERLGGRITVESEIDHGATFTVWVPLIFGATR